MTIRLIALLFLASLLPAAERFVASDSDAALSGAQLILTVQQPAGSGSNRVEFIAGEIYCSVVCVATLRRDGTAATTTAGTAVPVNRAAPAANANVFIDSNVGAGTVVHVWNLAAGQTLPVDLTGMFLARGGGTADNLTLEIAAITGSARVSLLLEE